MNTFFQKPNKDKATFKLVAADKETEPWTADGYAEIDSCLAHRKWANSIKNVYTDPYTNVHTDHKSVIAKLNQKLRTLETTKTERSFKGSHMPEDQESEFNLIIKSQQGEHDSDDDMNNFMKRIAIAAEHTMPDNKGYNTKQDCDPEILRFIKNWKDVMRGNDDNIKQNTKIIKKTARRIRTKKFVKGLKKRVTRKADGKLMRLEKLGGSWHEKLTLLVTRFSLRTHFSLPISGCFPPYVVPPSFLPFPVIIFGQMVMNATSPAPCGPAHEQNKTARRTNT